MLFKIWLKGVAYWVTLEIFEKLKELKEEEALKLVKSELEKGNAPEKGERKAQK
jgi:hypothetical protein